MFEIPIFPLNTVLFPGTPLKLHIFEERYKLMINECLDNSREFGVVLIAEGQEANGPLPQPHQTGCLAKITQFDRLDEGRMNITSMGTERFKIVKMTEEKPYLTGFVIPYPLIDDASFDLNLNIHRFQGVLKNYLEMMALAGGMEVDYNRIPSDPTELAYVAAYILQTSMEDKQLLLELEGITAYFLKLNELYKRETAIMKALISPPNIENAGSFSRN